MKWSCKAFLQCIARVCGGRECGEGRRSLPPCVSKQTWHVCCVKQPHLRYLRKTSPEPVAIFTDFVSCVNGNPKLDPVGEGLLLLPTPPWLSCLPIQPHLERKGIGDIPVGKERLHTGKKKNIQKNGESIGDGQVKT